MLTERAIKSCAKLFFALTDTPPPMAPLQGITGPFFFFSFLGTVVDRCAGSQLSTGRWAFAFSLVTSLFFTCKPVIDCATSELATHLFVFVVARGLRIWGKSLRSILAYPYARLTIAYQLLDVLNAHFQTIFGITKTQSTLLQLAYFGAYLVFAPFASIFVSVLSFLIITLLSLPQMRKKGYKAGIHLGLTLYSLGEAWRLTIRSSIVSHLCQARFSSGHPQSTRNMAASWGVRSSSVSIHSITCLV